MTFFNSISAERKIQIVEARINSLKEQLWVIFIDMGFIPEEVNVSTFNVDADFPEEFLYLKPQYVQTLEMIHSLEEIKLGLQG